MKAASLPLRPAATLAVLMASWTGVTPAFGQAATEKSAAAQAAFDEAMKLMREGRTAEACPKLKSAQKLDPGMATQFRLAECYEKSGQLASAWANYVEVADAAKAAKNKEREAFANKRAAALEPRLSRLTILVPPELSTLQELEIKRDGTVVDKALWGTAIPVDPGEHVVVATATGKKPWEGKGVATEQPTKLEVTIPPLEDLPSPPPVATPEPHPDAPPLYGRRSAVPAIIGGAAAVAAAGVGLTLLLVSNRKERDALTLDAQIVKDKRNCVSPIDSRCAKLDSMAGQVDTFRYVSVSAFIGGGLLAAGSLAYVLWPTPKPNPAPKKTGLDIHAMPVVGERQGAMVVWGAF